MAAREQQGIQAIGEIPAAAIIPAAEAAPADRYRIEAISDCGSLAQLKPEWDALLAQAGTDHPFLSHEWISTWWECFGANSGKALYILLVKDGARLAGIAPLMQGDKQMYGITVRCLEALYNPHTPRFDFIVAPHEAGDVYRSIWNHLRGVAGWDVLELAQLPADSRALATLSQLARRDRCSTGIWHGEQSPYLPLTGAFETFFSKLSFNHRAKVRRKLNRLKDRGTVRLEEVTTAELSDRALDEGFRIEAAGWKSHTGTAISSAPEVESFYRLLARRVAGQGQLRLLFLTVDGVRIAFAYGLFHRNKLYVMKTGYDPEYSYYSPYNLLCYLVFEEGFARGLEEYEFLGNNDAWKLSWTQLIRGHDWLYIFAPNWRARLLYQIKFRWLPLLKRQQFYRRLRDAMFPTGKARVAVAQEGE